MKNSKYLFAFFLFNIYSILLAQHGNNWPIGINSGISFTKKGIEKIETKIEEDTSNTASTWASRSVSFSDCVGNLILYGSSYDIWNRYGFVIEGGHWRDRYKYNNLHFYPILLVPQPNSARYFYYFSQFETGASDSLFYNIIDIEANNGNGRVLSNHFLSDHVTNNLTFALHANGQDLWILQAYDDKTLHTYLLTDTGINKTPIVSKNIFTGNRKYPYLNKSPFSPYRNSFYQSSFKVNNGRNKLICTSIDTCTTKSGCVWEYDFDNSTGKASNGKPIFGFNEIPIFSASSNIHRLEISTNDSFYYLMTYGANDPSKTPYTNRLYQYNVNTGKKTQVFNKKSTFSTMQLGPDGRIYFFDEKEYPLSTLYVIQFPNREGIDCRVINIRSDSDFYSTIHLPTLYQPYRPLYFYSNLEHSPCQDSANFQLHIDTTFRELYLYFGDGDSMRFTKPFKSIYNVNHTYKQTGKYYVYLKALTPVCDYYSYAGDTFQYFEKSKIFQLDSKTKAMCFKSLLEFTDSFYNAYMIEVNWNGNKDTLYPTSSHSKVKLSHVFNTNQFKKAYWEIMVSSSNCPRNVILNDSIDLPYFESDKIKYELSGFSKQTKYQSKELYAGCEPVKIDFKDTGKNTVNGLINWGTSSDYFIRNQTVRKEFSAGQYIISVVDTNTNGCIAYDTFLIHALTTPVIKWNKSHLNQCLLSNLIEINLTVDSGQAIVNWGDSDSSILKSDSSFTHRYSEAGSYKINIQTKSKQQCYTNTDSIVHIFKMPDARFVVNKDSQCLKDNLFQLKALDSGNHTWNFGVSDTLTPSHHYIDYGQHLINHIISDSNSCKDTSTYIVEVFESPQTVFLLSDTSLCLFTKPILLALSSQYSQVDQLKHKISWGDGNIDSVYGNTNIFHSYSDTGLYHITVEANTLMCEDISSIQIRIHPVPKTNLLVRGFCLGDSSSIEAVNLNSAVLIDNYRWQIDHMPVTEDSDGFKHMFEKSGEHRIDLTSRSMNFCESNDSISFQIYIKPKAYFTFANLSKTGNGLQFKFINQSILSNLWVWHFNHNDTSHQKDPIFTFLTDGFYPIRLIASNQNICFDTLQKLVPVFEQMEFYFPNVFSPNDNGINESFGLRVDQQFLVNEFSLEVYNRWGEKVFQTKDKTQTWNGGNSQQGMYIYKATIIDIFNIFHDYKGVVELMR